MGRSVSYPSEATVVTFKGFTFEPYSQVCGKCGEEYLYDDDGRCPSCGSFVKRAEDTDDFEQLIEDFQSHLKHLFPSVAPADSWIGREDHVLAENKLARFGMSEYCGLVAYWIVPKTEDQSYWGNPIPESNFSERWVKNIADKFVTAFGELSKVGSMSNGEGVYRRIDK